MEAQIQKQKMVCENCKGKAKQLHRINPMNEDGKFWCVTCIRFKMPKLFDNLTEHGLTDVMSVLHGLRKPKHQ